MVKLSMVDAYFLVESRLIENEFGKLKVSEQQQYILGCQQDL